MRKVKEGAVSTSPVKNGATGDVEDQEEAMCPRLLRDLLLTPQLLEVLGEDVVCVYGLL